MCLVHVAGDSLSIYMIMTWCSFFECSIIITVLILFAVAKAQSIFYLSLDKGVLSLGFFICLVYFLWSGDDPGTSRSCSKSSISLLVFSNRSFLHKQTTMSLQILAVRLAAYHCDSLNLRNSYFFLLNFSLSSSLISPLSKPYIRTPTGMLNRICVDTP